MAWPVWSISARSQPTCAAARLTITRKSGAFIRLEHEAMTSVPPCITIQLWASGDERIPLVGMLCEHTFVGRPGMVLLCG